MLAGAQLYIEAFPELAGHTFGEVLLMFHNATVLGLTTSDPSACARRVDYAIPDSDQHVVLNPPDDHQLQPGRCPLWCADNCHRLPSSDWILQHGQGMLLYEVHP